MTTVYFDVKYGEHENSYVDICFPENNEKNMGLIFYVHGGGFIAGDKGCHTADIRRCAENGYISASTNYRYVSENVNCFDVMEDLTASLKKVREFVAEKGIDIEKMLIVGSSAGAHLALLYAYSMADKAPIKPMAAVSYCGSTDVANTDMILDTHLDKPEKMVRLFSNLSNFEIDLNDFDTAIPALKKVSPLYYVNENTVPTVLIHGAKDGCVPPKNAQKLDAKLEESGIEHKYIILPNSDHGLGNDPECMEEAFRTLIEYADKYVKKGENL